MFNAPARKHDARETNAQRKHDARTTHAHCPSTHDARTTYTRARMTHALCTHTRTPHTQCTHNARTIYTHARTHDARTTHSHDDVDVPPNPPAFPPALDLLMSDLFALTTGRRPTRPIVCTELSKARSQIVAVAVFATGIMNCPHWSSYERIGRRSGGSHNDTVNFYFRQVQEPQEYRKCIRGEWSAGRKDLICWPLHCPWTARHQEWFQTHMHLARFQEHAWLAITQMLEVLPQSRVFDVWKRQDTVFVLDKGGDRDNHVLRFRYRKGINTSKNI